MSITKPYFRIFRPGNDIPSYPVDARNADNCATLCRALTLLEQDLKTLFEFVEPCDENLHTFSHRIYELILRASTEFETNAKEILSANRYTRTANESLNIFDYHRIDQATRLSDFRVEIEIWRPSKKVIAPFSEWKKGPRLSWYKAYNDVKHNRHHRFHDANLENAVTSICAVAVILYCQFDFYTFISHRADQVTIPVGDDRFAHFSDTIFRVVKPTDWPDDQRYSFNWEQIKADPEPFQKYDFDSCV